MTKSLRTRINLSSKVPFVTKIIKEKKLSSTKRCLMGDHGKPQSRLLFAGWALNNVDHIFGGNLNVGKCKDQRTRKRKSERKINSAILPSTFARPLASLPLSRTPCFSCFFCIHNTRLRSFDQKKLAR